MSIWMCVESRSVMVEVNAYVNCEQFWLVVFLLYFTDRNAL